MSRTVYDLTSRQYERAYANLKKAVAIAEPLAAEPGDEGATWANKLDSALAQLGVAELGLGRVEDGTKTLRRRPFAKGLPVDHSETREIPPLLIEYEITLAGLELDLAIANVHLRALLRQNELLKQALRERFRRLHAAGAPKAAAAKAVPAPKAASGMEKKKSIDKMLGAIALSEMIMTLRGDGSDRDLVDQACSLFAEDISEALQDPAEAVKLVQRRLDFNRRQVDRLAANLAEAERTKNSYTADKVREQIANAWLSIFSAHVQSGKINAKRGGEAAAWPTTTGPLRRSRRPP